MLAPPPLTSVEPAAEPSFSVLIAAYEAAETVGEAVASALDQTLPPYEVIVCDDGSTDDTEAVLAPLRDRITYLRRDENGGEGAAKNSAARVAAGDFLLFLDADDIYLPERIEALADLSVARPDLGLITTDAYLEKDGRRVGRYYRERVGFAVDDQRLEIVQRNFIFGHAAIRRDAFLGVGGFDESIRWTADWDLFLRLIFAGVRAGLVDLPLASYRLQERALTSDRVSTVRGGMETLDKAARELDLTAEERAVLERSREAHALTAALEETRLALLNDAPGARRRARAVAADRRYPWRTRVKALLAAVVPQITRPPAWAPRVRLPHRGPGARRRDRGRSRQG